MKCWAPRGVHAPRTAGTWTETRMGEEVLSAVSGLHTEPESQFLTQRLLRCGETGQRQLTLGPFCLPAHGFRMRESSSGLQTLCHVATVQLQQGPAAWVRHGKPQSPSPAEPALAHLSLVLNVKVTTLTPPGVAGWGLPRSGRSVTQQFGRPRTASLD